MRQLEPSTRTGSLLICVLVCIGIATSIMLTALNGSLRARRQIGRELQMEQTRWLVDAGIARGLNKLQEHADYTGETWSVAPALNANQVATIEITLNDEGQPAGKSRLSVTATICGQDLRSQTTRRTGLLIIDRTDPSKPTSPNITE